MPSYHSLGEVPSKRHVQFRSPSGQLYAEEVFAHEGFSGSYSILYHRGLPPQTRRTEPIGPVTPELWTARGVHRNHHLRTGLLESVGDPTGSRTPLLFNEDVVISLAAPLEPQSGFYKNGTRDELIFVHEGDGVLATQ